jgi:uncharacterized protein (TIGR00661 family)
VRVERLPGLRFAYDERHRLRYPATAAHFLGYLKQMPATLDWLARLIHREQPDLVITDFEPALPRAARRCGVPFISLNHQHFLRTYDLRSLPLRLRWRAAYMGVIVGACYSGQVETIVSSFYFPPLRPGCAGVTQVGVLLRPEVLAARPHLGAHLVAYGRRFVDERVLRARAGANLEARVYGLGVQPPRGRVSFHAVNATRFIEDLAGCSALVCTAGNQLVGEALYLRKPVLALAETNNFEQEINAHFLRQSGAGDALSMADFTEARLHRFLARLDGYRSRISTERLNGLPAVLAVLRRHLPAARPASHPQLAAA